MVNKRASLIFLGFIVLTVSVITVSLSISVTVQKAADVLEVETIEESVFKTITYFSVEDNKPGLILDADQITLFGELEVSFVNPNGTAYDEEEKDDPINYRAKKGKYIKRDKKLYLDHEVVVEQSGSTHNSEHVLMLTGDQKEFYADGEVETNTLAPKTGDKLTITS